MLSMIDYLPKNVPWLGKVTLKFLHSCGINSYNWPNRDDIRTVYFDPLVDEFMALPINKMAAILKFAFEALNNTF